MSAATGTCVHCGYTLVSYQMMVFTDEENGVTDDCPRCGGLWREEPAVRCCWGCGCILDMASRKTYLAAYGSFCSTACANCAWACIFMRCAPIGALR